MLRLYQHIDFKGQQKEFTGTTSDIKKFPKKGKTPGGRASSLEVIQEGDYDEWWLIFEKKDYKGNSLGPIKSGEKIADLRDYDFNDKPTSVIKYTEKATLDYDMNLEGENNVSPDLEESDGEVPPDKSGEGSGGPPSLFGFDFSTSTLLTILIAVLAIVVIALFIVKKGGGS